MSDLLKTSLSEHPSEEVLERFLLRHIQEEELDRVESHILVCEHCVTRLGQLELQIAALKLALSELPAPQKATAPAGALFPAWLTLRHLSWAGALAALVLTVSLAPTYLGKSGPVANVSLEANRGLSLSSVPHDTELHLHLSAQGLSDGPVTAILVDSRGAEVWKSAAAVEHDHVDIHAPKLAASGIYYLRLYSQPAGAAPGDLLREFPFEVN